MDSIDSTIYEFDRYQLNIPEGVLLRDGEPVPMQWKAFETLCVLVRSEGRLVSRDELIEKIWPNSYVEENNLSQQIGNLRKLLGNGDEGPPFIETVPRRGYRFLPAVSAVKGQPAIENGQGLNQQTENASVTAALLTQPTIETAAPDPGPVAPAPRRGFSRKAVLITVICISVVSVVGFISWRNRPRTASDKIWKNAGEDQQSLFASAAAQRISDAFDGVISPDGMRVVYTSEVAGQQVMWLYQVASGRAIQIGGPLERGYGKILFSGDGEFVYYSTGTPKGFEIYRIPVIGGEPEKLAEGTGAQFTISPNDSHIATMTRDAEKKLCVLVKINFTDRSEVPIAANPYSRCFGALAWSPNGRFIAASLGNAESGASNNDLVEISVDGEETRSLTAEKWVIIRDIVWLKDRSSVLLTGRKKQSDFVQIWQVRRSTGEAKQVSTDASNYSTISLSDDGGTLVTKKTDLKSYLYVAPVEMPDRGTAIVHAFGRIAWLSDHRLVYGSYKQDTLWSITHDGSFQKQIGANNDMGVCASPDGRYIYSVSAEGGAFHIWRMNANGSNRVQFSKTKDSEQYPAVSPDNRWVYFDSITPEGTSIKRMPVGGGAIQNIHGVGASRPSLSPDGRLLAFVMHNENGFDPLGIGVSSPDGSGTVRIQPANRITGSRIEWTEDSAAIYYTAKEPDGSVNIWLHPLSGEAPVKITSFSSDLIFDFMFSPDRMRIAYVRGNWTRDVVKMDFVD